MNKKSNFSPSDFSKKKTATPPSSENKDKPGVKKHRKSKRSFLKEKDTDTKRPYTDKPKNLKKDNTRNPKQEERFPENDNPYFQSNIKVPKKTKSKGISPEEEKMPLNKYIAHCGICSRRDAIELIKKGKVKVNSLIEVNPAVKVNAQDYIIYDGKRVFPQKNLVYYLLNKPKNYICTTDDPEERNTVLDFFREIENIRLYPVGRLDRNTTGLLLITNDGELAQKLSHPKYNIKKIYQVTLDKALTKKDFEKIIAGVTLEDGLAPVDEIAYINPKNKKEVGLQIHSGKNRIVRRIFAHLGYKVTALDRVVYAGLTKKNIPRGTYRLLDEKEIIYLKHFK